MKAVPARANRLVLEVIGVSEGDLQLPAEARRIGTSITR